MNSIKELFSRLFVLAINNKINPDSFINLLMKSVFIKKIEEKQYSDYFNKSIIDIFFDITSYQVDNDNSYGIYNDAYWSGYSYYELYLRLNKPFSFIFLKLPLSKMLDIYPIFHEMDISSLIDYFNKLDKEKTILRLLCEQKRCSLPKLSNITKISVSTLRKYNASDEALYNASFQNIIKISRYFDTPINLFIDKI